MNYTEMDAIKRTFSQGYLRIYPLEVLVKVLDIRHVWGKVQYLVTPVAGNGSQWVDSSRLRVEDSTQ